MKERVKKLLAATLVAGLFFTITPAIVSAEEQGNTVDQDGLDEGSSIPDDSFECGGDHPLAASLLENLNELNDQLDLQGDYMNSAVQFSQVEQITYQKVTPSEGDVNTLVVMVDFSDVKFDENFTNEYVQDLMFAEPDENSPKFPLESLSAWYKRSSFGKLNIYGNVINVHLDHARDDYTVDENTDENSPEVTADIWDALCGQDIDWSKYDGNNDNYVDSLVLVVAGDTGEWASTWWSRCFYGNVKPIDKDNMYQIGTYAYCIESQMKSSDTVIHEYGHMLGLPDLYNTDAAANGRDSAAEGIHTSDMMCQNIGDMNGLCKMLLGWLDESQIHIVEYGQDVSDIRLRPYAESGDIALCMVNEGDNSLFSECYMAEYFVPSENDSVLGVPDAPSNYMRLFHVNAELDASGTMLAHDNLSSGVDDDCLLIQAVDHDAEYIHGMDYWDTAPVLGKRVYRAIFNRNACCGYQEGDELTPYTTPSTNKYAEDRLKDSPGLYSGLSVTDIKLSEEYAEFSVSFEDEATDSEGIDLKTVVINRGCDGKDIQIQSNREIYYTDSSIVAYVRKKDTKEFVENVRLDTSRVWPAWLDIYPYHYMMQAVLSDESKLSDDVDYEIVFPEGMFTTGYGMQSGEIILDGPKLYHSLNEFKAKPATCKEEGNIAYWYCGSCQKYFADEELTTEITKADTILAKDSTNHAEPYLQNQLDATETEDGYTGDLYCNACDVLIKKGTVIPATAHKHSATKTEEKAATCKEEGNITYWYCADCGKYYSDEALSTEITEADTIHAKDSNNHVGGTYLKNQSGATETEDGYTGDTHCKGCDALLEQGTVIPATGHQHVTKTEGKAATCKEAGNITYWHCSDCGKYFSDEQLTKEITEADTKLAKDSSNHVGGTYLKNQSEATETEDGYTGDTHCKGCDALLEQGAVIPATGHQHVTKTEEKAATCKEVGNITYWHCSDCGKYFSDEQLTKEITEADTKLAKDSSNHVGGTYLKNQSEATETEDGYTGDTHCKGCDALLEQGTVIPATGHQHVTKTEGKAATCKEAGNITYWHCSDCGKYFSDEQLTKEITEADTILAKDSTNHVGGTYLKNQSEATATTAGYTGDKHCKGCDALLEKGTVIPATGSGNSGGSSSGSGGTGGSSTGGGSTGGSSSGSGSTGGASSDPSKDPVDTTDDKQKDKDVTTTQNPDGSEKEVVKETETNSKGKEVTVTTTTETDRKGKVTGVTEKSKIDNIASDTSATVTVKSDGKGEVTSATAAVSKNIAKDSNKATISANVIEQIKEAAGTDVNITMTVKDSDGKTKYKLKVDTADLKAGKDLYIYQLDTKTGEYMMVNAKTYAVSKKGDVSVSMNTNATYELLSEKEAKKVEKQILSTVKVKKSTASVKKGEKTSVAFSSGLNMKNVKGISYSTSSKSVATVSKSGAIITKKQGSTTIKAKITLKNGTTKIVKMKIVVK